MAVASFSPQQIITITGEAYEILRMVSDKEWQLEHTTSGRIISKTDRELLGHYVAGELKFILQNQSAENLVQKHTKQIDSIESIDPNLKSEAITRLAYVRAIEESGTTTYTPSSLNPIIEKVHTKIKAPETPPNWSTINRWRKRYIEGGKDIRALVPKLQQKGNRTRRYGDKLLELIRKAIHSRYMTRERPTMIDTYYDAVELVRKENLLRPKEIHLPIPTKALVKKEINSIPAYDRHAARHGIQAAKMKFRSVLGHNFSERPLQTAEIDHTILDMMVVDDESMLPLGRPTLTVCQDVMSRCILGFYVGFEPPSFVTVAQCLKQSILPKVTTKEDHPSVSNSWECHGVMETLVVDNGLEFHSANLEALCLPFGINIQFCPRKQAWFKPHVERVIQTMNCNVAHGNPGSTFSNILEKDDYDAAQKATITLSTFIEIIHIWVIDIYHQDVHRTLDQKPIEVWRENVSQMHTNLPADPNDMDCLTGSATTRDISHKGVNINNLLYNSREIEDLRKQIGAEIKNVTIRYNESDLGYIYVIHPVNGTQIKVPALNQPYAKGLSLWQHKVCKRFAKTHLSRTDIEGLAQAKALIRELIERDFGKKKIKSRSKATRFLNSNDATTTQAIPPVGPINRDAECKSANYERREMATEIHDPHNQGDENE